ncbi:hypothetical protein [Levilactobacillus sp. N40-8-2]|uniref:hypothetical protein n=1 Tax=Levilactobacillus muriae TaxID=3238987 RepID=UPI0038B26A14
MEAGVSASSEFYLPSNSLMKGSVTGTGGTARLNVSANRRNIYWSVKPKTTGPWLFGGTLKLRYYSGYSRNITLHGWGALGGSYSENIGINKNNGGKVYLSGTARDYSGHPYSVLPNFHVAF